MSISKNKIEVEITNLNNTEVKINNILKSRKIESIICEEYSSISIAEIRFLRDRFENKLFFHKIIKNAKGSIFLNGILTPTEEAFYNTKIATLKQVAFFAIYYRNQLKLPESFDKIIKNTNGIFDNWFNNYIKYNLLIKLKAFYDKTIFNISEIMNITFSKIDIQIERKSTITFIEKTFLNDFKQFLFTDWENSLNKNLEFNQKQAIKTQTILFD